MCEKTGMYLLLFRINFGARSHFVYFGKSIENHINTWCGVYHDRYDYDPVL